MHLASLEYIILAIVLSYWAYKLLRNKHDK